MALQKQTITEIDGLLFIVAQYGPKIKSGTSTNAPGIRTAVSPNTPFCHSSTFRFSEATVSLHPRTDFINEICPNWLPLLYQIRAIQKIQANQWFLGSNGQVFALIQVPVHFPHCPPNGARHQAENPAAFARPLA
jgi:hypothetical protein